jgi:two-component system, NarL family, sensor histidine kinase DesK
MSVYENFPRRQWVFAGMIAGLILVLVAILLFGLSPLWIAVLLSGAALVAAAWAWALLRAQKAAHEAALARWTVAEAIYAERLQIARDLHDIISHGLGMITIRAATARHLHAQTASEAGLLEAIIDVEDLSRQTTLELRRMLQTLREDGEPAPRQPVDSLARLPELIESAQRAGLEVELDQADLGVVSPGAQLTICAVVREGLANCARHAGSTRAKVNLRREQDAISIIITDAGPGDGWAAAPGAGTGLIGLRERVHSLGGRLQAGPHEKGYRLEAHFPDGTQ